MIVAFGTELIKATNLCPQKFPGDATFYSGLFIIIIIIIIIIINIKDWTL